MGKFICFWKILDMNDKSLLEGLKSGQALNIDAQVLPVFIAWLLHCWEDFGPHILISHQQNLLELIQQNLKFFEKHQKSYFMENRVLDKPNELNVSLQREALRSRWFYKALSARSSDVFMTDFQSLVQKMESSSEFKKQFMSITPGMTLTPNFFQQLQNLGWQERERVELVGEFSQRGMVLDLFSPARDTPVRLELTGWEVERIRELDPVTQVSKNTVDEIVILPFSNSSELKKEITCLAYFKKTPLIWFLDDWEDTKLVKETFSNKEFIKSARFLIFKDSFYSCLEGLSLKEQWRKTD